MKERLPVNIENNTLPIDTFNLQDENNKNNYGFVSTMYLISLLITLGSVITLIIIGS